MAAKPQDAKLAGAGSQRDDRQQRQGELADLGTEPRDG
jgi:hypothetical protein